LRPITIPTWIRLGFMWYRNVPAYVSEETGQPTVCWT